MTHLPPIFIVMCVACLPVKNPCEEDDCRCTVRMEPADVLVALRTVTKAPEYSEHELSMLEWKAAFVKCSIHKKDP